MQRHYHAPDQPAAGHPSRLPGDHPLCWRHGRLVAGDHRPVQQPVWLQLRRHIRAGDVRAIRRPDGADQPRRVWVPGEGPRPGEAACGLEASGLAAAGATWHVARAFPACSSAGATCAPATPGAQFLMEQSDFPTSLAITCGSGAAAATSTATITFFPSQTGDFPFALDPPLLLRPGVACTAVQGGQAADAAAMIQLKTMDGVFPDFPDYPDHACVGEWGGRWQVRRATRGRGQLWCWAHRPAAGPQSAPLMRTTTHPPLLPPACCPRSRPLGRALARAVHFYRPRRCNGRSATTNDVAAGQRRSPNAGGPAACSRPRAPAHGGVVHQAGLGAARVSPTESVSSARAPAPPTPSPPSHPVRSLGTHPTHTPSQATHINLSQAPCSPLTSSATLLVPSPPKLSPDLPRLHCALPMLSIKRLFD